MIFQTRSFQVIHSAATTLMMVCACFFGVFPAGILRAESAAPSYTADDAVLFVPPASSPQATPAPSPASTGSTTETNNASTAAATSASADTGNGAMTETASTAGVNPQLAVTGDINDFETDEFTGHFGYSVPIKLPPARGGSEPKVSLSYNSSSGNGWCGVGWSLDMGYIARETRNGVPVLRPGGAAPITAYNDAKGFVFSLNGVSSRLVNAGGNVYRAHIEGAFLTFVFLGGTSG